MVTGPRLPCANRTILDLNSIWTRRRTTRKRFAVSRAVRVDGGVASRQIEPILGSNMHAERYDLTFWPGLLWVIALIGMAFVADQGQVVKPDEAKKQTDLAEEELRGAIVC